MDPSRPSTSGSSNDQSLQNPFASASEPLGLNFSGQSSAPESPSAGGFPFHTSASQSQSTSPNGYMTHSHSQSSIHQRRSTVGRPGTNQSNLSASGNAGDMLTFAPRPRDPPPASFMGPPRIGSMASRDSAFAAPPVRQATPSLNDGGRGAKPVKAVPFKSTALIREADGSTNIHKPWLEKKDPYIKISYFVTWGLFLFLGLGGTALAIFLSYRNFPKIPNYCPVLEDNFDTLDLNTWNQENDLGGFGNHQFDMATPAEANSYVKDNKLYITPTLTADTLGYDQILNGFTYNLTDCTNLIDSPNGNGTRLPNPDACGVVSNSTAGVMIPPIMSARLNTKGKASIAYGKVVVRAKLPRGDWLWPAIWMQSEEEFYGPWPMSGEIDIMEARGNGKKYPAQGVDYVRGSLNWGPTTFMNAVSKTYGWWFERRNSFDQGFHDYTLEWTPDFLWTYVDSRLHRSFDIRFDKSFFDRGKFPSIITNTTTGQQVVLQNPWEGGPKSAPFDRNFYLILNVAVGGTNGWFPDGAGDKPWLDNSKTAMQDFWAKRDDWLSTWGDPEQHSMIVESVKMYKVC